MRVDERPVAPGAPGSSRLHLNFGPNPVLRTLPLLIAIAASIAILVSMAGWSLKILVLAGLGISAFGVRQVSNKRCRRGTLILCRDESVLVATGDGLAMDVRLLDNAWTSHWFSVVGLIEPESNRQYYYVVCASENLAGNYRRLLKFLHMRSASPDNHKVHG